jgi:hypothetical protein
MRTDRFGCLSCVHSSHKTFSSTSINVALNDRLTVAFLNDDILTEHKRHTNNHTANKQRD